MNENSDPRPLADWLRLAYAGQEAGCPPPETWLREELAELAPETRATLEDHAETCPACAAERELASAFDEGEEAVDAADLEWVLAKARTAAIPTPAEGNRPPGRVVPFRGRLSPPILRLAAAATLFLAAGLAFQTLRSPAPPLPSPPAGGVLRSGEVGVVAPVGEVAARPRALRWRAVAGAERYRVRILAVDDTPLWETTVTTHTADLTAVLTAKLEPAVSYVWSVEALAPDGRVVARSHPTRFRIAPPPESDPTSAPATTLEIQR